MQAGSDIRYAFNKPPLRFSRREPYCQTTFGAFSTQELKADALANRDLVSSLYVSGLDTTLSADEVPLHCASAFLTTLPACAVKAFASSGFRWVFIKAAMLCSVWISMACKSVQRQHMFEATNVAL